MTPVELLFISTGKTPDAADSRDEELKGMRRALGSMARFTPSPLATLSDIISDLKTNPQIVHICAHGVSWGEIILLDSGNNPKPADRRAFAQAFSGYGRQVRLVFLNVCNSFEQAEDLKAHIDCVIGVRENIPLEAAKDYAIRFYQSLSERASVAKACEDGLTVLKDNHRKLTDGQRPELVCRKGVDPWKIFLVEIGEASEDFQNLISAKQASFNNYRQNCGIWIDTLTITKVCYDDRSPYLQEDGSSSLRYDVYNLTVENGEIDGYRIHFKSQAGVVGAPDLDERAQELGIRWEPSPVTPAETLEDLVKQLRSTAGTFLFDERLTRGNGPYSFGWTIRVLNLDALSEWEFYNLYPAAEIRAHINGKPMDPPSEYFLDNVRLPIRQLVVRIMKPGPWMAPPKLRYFELAGQPEIRKEYVITDGKAGLRMPRPQPLPESRRNIADIEKAALHEYDDGRTYGIVLRYPTLGSYYSLDWRLPNPEMSTASERLVREADTLRKELLEHRKRRMEGGTNAVSRQIESVFRGLHSRLYEQFGFRSSIEKFETALMTYDESSCNLVVAEAGMNSGEPPKPTWRLALPFGIGVGGTCFRQAYPILYARKVDPKGRTQLDYYLPHPGTEPHEFLLALPMNHPDLDESPEEFDGHLCRQLIGVMTISSTVAASRLFHYCVVPQTEAKRTEFYDRLYRLWDECQAECDQISELLLNQKSVSA